MPEYENRRQRARVVELSAGGVAAGAGVGLGAAKLRDDYKKQYPARFTHGLGHLQNRARRVTPRRAAKLVRVADTGTPGFKTVAIGAATAATAAGARHYQTLTRIEERRHAAKLTRAREAATVGKSAFGVVH